MRKQTVDRFVLRTCRQLSRYIAVKSDPMSIGTDAK